MECLRAERGQDTHAQCEFGDRAVETNEAKRQIVSLRLAFFIIREGVDAIEHGGLFSDSDPGVLDEVPHSIGCSYSRRLTRVF